jgi:drug/metabolite transporter (DMT)-like permease
MIYLAVALSAAMAAAGQVLLKLGATGVAGVGLVNARVIGGLAIYGVALLIWLYALSKLPLYVVYPFTLITSFLVLVGAMAILGERPSATAIAGWAVVGIGIGLVAWGSTSAA